MRKKLRILMLAAVVAALIVPFGFALSNDGSERTALAVTRDAVPSSDISTSNRPIVVAGTMIAVPQLPEGAKLFAIGTVLFALAAAMRRSS
jgi:hypothetical protein